MRNWTVVLLLIADAIALAAVVLTFLIAPMILGALIH